MKSRAKACIMPALFQPPLDPGDGLKTRVALPRLGNWLAKRAESLVRDAF
jgi:hypothetical protein